MRSLPNDIKYLKPTSTIYDKVIRCNEKVYRTVREQVPKVKLPVEIREMEFDTTDLDIGKWILSDYLWEPGYIPENIRINWRRWIDSLSPAELEMAYDNHNPYPDGKIFMPAEVVLELKNYIDKWSEK